MMTRATDDAPTEAMLPWSVVYDEAMRRKVDAERRERRKGRAGRPRRARVGL